MAKQLENLTIYQILRYDAILREIARCPMLIVPFYRSVFNSCAETCGFYHKSNYVFYNGNAGMGEDDWRPSFDTLRKNGFIEIVDIETYHVYVEADSGRCRPEIINITDEEYNNLPEYFKSKVEVQTRTRNIYKLNAHKIKEIAALAEVLSPYFN